MNSPVMLNSGWFEEARKGAYDEPQPGRGGRQGLRVHGRHDPARHLARRRDRGPQGRRHGRGRRRRRQGVGDPGEEAARRAPSPPRSGRASRRAPRNSTHTGSPSGRPSSSRTRSATRPCSPGSCAFEPLAATIDAMLHDTAAYACRTRAPPRRRAEEIARHGIRVNLGSTGLKVSPDLPRHHDLRLQEMARLGPRGGGEPALSSSAPSRLGINFFDTADMYSRRRERGDPRAGAQGLRPGPRPGRHRDQGVQPDGRRPEPARALEEAHPPRDRGQPEAPRHGLRRPLPDPPLRPADARRGDHGGAERPRPRGQGPATSGRPRCSRGSSRRCWTPRAAAVGRRFVTMQNHYNLLYREEEREMLPLCADEADRAHPLEPARAGHARAGRSRPPDDPREDRRVRPAPLRRGAARARPVGRRRGAEGRRGPGRPAAQVALAWVCQKPGSSPRSSAPRRRTTWTRCAALSLKLTDEENAALEAHYAPRPVRGHT